MNGVDTFLGLVCVVNNNILVHFQVRSELYSGGQAQRPIRFA